MKKYSLLFIVVLSILLSVVFQSQASAQRYIITLLGTLGGTHSRAISINDFGQVVGFSGFDQSLPFKSHAFIWDHENGMQDMGTLGGSESEAFDINNLGVVVGRVSIGESYNPLHAFIWDHKNGMRDVGTFGGVQSYARAISNNGEVIGGISTGDYSSYAFHWTPEKGITNLGNLGFPISEAHGINDLGQVVGASHITSTRYCPFLWDSQNGMINLGVPDGYLNALALDINNSSQVVVNAHFNLPNGTLVNHAFIWDSKNGMKFLGTLGGDFSYAIRINDHGQVVGYSTKEGVSSPWRYAFIWDKKNGMRDLNDFLPNDYKWIALRDAWGINNLGQIVGYCQPSGAFLMSPIPGLKLNQAAGVPTAQVTVNGSGFSAYEAVDVYFDTEDLCLGATNGSGAFSCSLMIPREAIPGTHWLTAVGRKSGFAAQKSFLVRVNWSQFGNGPQHRGYNPYENVISPGNVANLKEAWIYNTGDFQHTSSPAVVNGVVYVGSRDGNLYALDAFTGAFKWSYATGDEIVSSPAVANGLVYVGSYDGNLYALDAKTGAFKWSYPTGDRIFSSPAVADEVVYVGSRNGKLYALDAATGVFKWNYPTGDWILSSPAVANGVVYAGSYDGNFYALDAATGALKWSYPTGNSNFSSPAVANGVVYVGGGGGTLYAIKAKTGALKWSFTTGFSVTSSPAVANGMVYVGLTTPHEYPPGNYDGNFYALDAATGVLKWIYPIGWEQDAFSQTVANGVVYVVSDSSTHGYGGDFYALDAATGAMKWRYPTCSGYLTKGSPAVANGLVYVGLENDNLYCFSLDPAGVLSQKIPRPDPTLLIPDDRLKPQVKKR